MFDPNQLVRMGVAKNLVDAKAKIGDAHLYCTPQVVVLTATVRDLRESRGNKRTHFKLDSNVGHVAWKDFVVTGIRDEDSSTRTYNHRVTVTGFVVTKIKNPKLSSSSLPL